MDYLIYNADIFTGYRYIKNGFICVVGGRVIEIGDMHSFARRQEEQDNVEKVDASGLLVFPALVDPHVHIRSYIDGQHHVSVKDTISDALSGGYRAIGCMPNTTPIADSESFFSSASFKDQINESKYCKIVQYGATTTSLLPFHVTDIQLLNQKFGVYIFSNDGIPIDSISILNQLFKTASKFDIHLLLHCEDGELNMEYSGRLKAYEKSSEAETMSIFKVLTLLYRANVAARLHICHVSSTESLELIESFKKKLNFTCEVTPHHLVHSRASLLNMPIPTYLKCNPPICDDSDRRNLVEALAKGVIDMVATDHAPHQSTTKIGSWDAVRYGVVGLKWAFKSVLSVLSRVCSFEETLSILYRVMVERPAKLLRIEKTAIKEGWEANFFLFDSIKASVENSYERYFVDMPGQIKHLFLRGERLY